MAAGIPGLVSVVMLVRDQVDHTRMALQSIDRCDGEFEVVVVDNGSVDSTEEFLDDWRDRAAHPVTVLRFDDDEGGARRRNIGAAASRGEYLFFVDNDVVADEPHVMTALVAELAADPRAAAASPLLRFPGTSDLVQCAGGGSTATGHIGLVGRGELLNAGHRRQRVQTWAPTAALLVRRRSFLGADGFDEAFDPVPLCEDVDLCCRLRSAGEHLVFVGRVGLRHYEGTTFNRIGRDKLVIWKRHMRVIRARWSEVFARGPHHSEEELAWRPVVKDYGNLHDPRAHILADGGTPPHDLTFFAALSEPADTLSSDLRVGVAGCGQAALRGALPAFGRPDPELAVPAPAPFLDFPAVPGVRLVGVADPDRAALLTAARAYRVLHALPDAHALLDRVPLEGMVICTPPTHLAELAVAALRRGIGVLVEKPAVLDERELADLESASSDVVCSINLPWAYHPALDALRAAIGDGVIGIPDTFAVVFEHCGPRLWSPRASWYEDPSVGVVTDLGLHVLDALQRALGGPVTVVETVGSTLHHCIAEARVGSAVGTVQVSWAASAPRFTVRVAGQGGSLVADLIPFRASQPALSWHVGDQAERLPVAPGPMPDGPYRDFAAALRGGPQPRTHLGAEIDAVRALLTWRSLAQRANREAPARRRA